MERDIETGDFRTEAAGTDGLAICETSGRTAALTHCSFEQLATIAGAPPKYLRSLPAPIASDAINFGLRHHRRTQHQLFVDSDAPWTVHAITSSRYPNPSTSEWSHGLREFPTDCGPGCKRRIYQLS